MLEDIIKTLPFWILGLGGVFILILEVFFKKNWPRTGISTLICLLSIAILIFTAGLGYYKDGESAFYGMIYSDPLFIFSTFLICLSAIFVLFMSYKRNLSEGIQSEGEFYGLILMSSAGALIFANAREFVSLFLGLEIMSMAVYCLCGSSIARRESTESALKYFLLGSFSSAFFLYGMALLYGVSGSLVVPDVALKIASSNSSVVMLSMGLMIFGFAFKIGLFPVNFWVPDVYQGAPTSITAFMATIIKASSVIAFIRIMLVLFPNFSATWVPLVWIIAVTTIVFGNLIALRQRNLKRMLAYSSIAHAGYMLCAFIAPFEFNGFSAVLFYLVGYTFVSLGAFAILCSFKIKDSSSFDISALYGLAKTNPLIALSLSLFMFTLAGLPPGMAGFLGKFYVFSAVVAGGYWGLAVIAMLGSAVSCYFYLRVVVAMYFINGTSNQEPVIEPMSLLNTGVIFFCSVLSVLIGVFPQRLYEIALIVFHSI